MTARVRASIWSTIRHAFTTDERAALNKAIVGEVICPRMVIVDLDQVAAALAAKLKEQVEASNGRDGG